MIIEKNDWTEEELDTIYAFRMFLRDKMDEVKNKVPSLHKMMDDIDYMLYLLTMNYHE